MWRRLLRFNTVVGLCTCLERGINKAAVRRTERMCPWPGWGGANGQLTERHKDTGPLWRHKGHADKKEIQNSAFKNILSEKGRTQSGKGQRISWLGNVPGILMTVQRISQKHWKKPTNKTNTEPQMSCRSCCPFVAFNTRNKMVYISSSRSEHIGIPSKYITRTKCAWIGRLGTVEKGVNIKMRSTFWKWKKQGRKGGVFCWLCFM